MIAHQTISTRSILRTSLAHISRRALLTCAPQAAHRPPSGGSAHAPRAGRARPIHLIEVFYLVFLGGALDVWMSGLRAERASTPSRVIFLLALFFLLLFWGLLLGILRGFLDIAINIMAPVPPKTPTALGLPNFFASYFWDLGL